MLAILILKTQEPCEGSFRAWEKYGRKKERVSALPTKENFPGQSSEQGISDYYPILQNNLCINKSGPEIRAAF